MESGAALARGGIHIVIRVVVGEGELLGHVLAGLSGPQVRHQRLHLILGQGDVVGHSPRERRVSHVDARVDDRDDLPLTLLRDLVGAHHKLGAQIRRVLPLRLGGPGATFGIHGRHVADVPLALQERRTHAARRPDRVQGTGGRAQREADQGVVVLALHLHPRSRELPGHCLVDRGEGGGGIRPVIELDDDADEVSAVSRSPTGRDEAAVSVAGLAPETRGEATDAGPVTASAHAPTNARRTAGFFIDISLLQCVHRRLLSACGTPTPQPPALKLPEKTKMTSRQPFSKNLSPPEVSNTTGPGNASIVAFPGPGVRAGGSDHQIHTPFSSK